MDREKSIDDREGKKNRVLFMNSVKRKTQKIVVLFRVEWRRPYSP
jgi:hypothetical protein